MNPTKTLGLVAVASLTLIAMPTASAGPVEDVVGLIPENLILEGCEDPQNSFQETYCGARSVGIILGRAVDDSMACAPPRYNPEECPHFG